MSHIEDIEDLNKMLHDVEQRQKALYLINQNELTSEQQKSLEGAIFSNANLIIELALTIKKLKTSS